MYYSNFPKNLAYKQLFHFKSRIFRFESFLILDRAVAGHLGHDEADMNVILTSFDSQKTWNSCKWHRISLRWFQKKRTLNKAVLCFMAWSASFAITRDSRIEAH